MLPPRAQSSVGILPPARGILIAYGLLQTREFLHAENVPHEAVPRCKANATGGSCFAALPHTAGT